MKIEARELRSPARCCLCEYEMHVGEKAVIVARDKPPTYVLHPECVTAMKELIDKDDAAEDGNSAA